MQSAKGDNVQHIDLDTAKNVWPFSSSFPLHMTRTRPCNDVRLTCEDCFFLFVCVGGLLMTFIESVKVGRWWRHCSLGLQWSVKSIFLRNFVFLRFRSERGSPELLRQKVCSDHVVHGWKKKYAWKLVFFQWFSLYPTVQDMFDRHRGGRERGGRNKLLYIFRDKRWGIIYLKYV